MNFIKRIFSRKKLRKLESCADQQYLDALEIIKDTFTIYLDLMAAAAEEGRMEDVDRLEQKLNSNFEYYVKNWNGQTSITHKVSSICFVSQDHKRLKIE
jgi:hypothetical protein